GLICNKILYGKLAWFKKAGNLLGLAALCFLTGLTLIFVPFAASITSLQSGLVLVFWAVAAVSFTKMMVDRARGPENWMDMVLPKLSLDRKSTRLNFSHITISYAVFCLKKKKKKNEKCYNNKKKKKINEMLNTL